jgi:hypothetical protein
VPPGVHCFEQKAPCPETLFAQMFEAQSLEVSHGSP